MNKKIIIVPLLLSVAILPLILPNKTAKVVAYDASGLPTTIDLNDTSETVIRSYYSNLNSLSQSERSGTNLLKNLKPILSNGQKYYNYDTGKDNIWKMYEIIDRDWEKSPANGTTYGTYNAIENRIEDYVYGTSASNSKNNPFIHALYINRNVENLTTAWDNHNQDEWGINQEHIWAKSNGFEDEAAGGARGDPMHLWAGNGYTNKIHSNLYFGNVDKTKTYTDIGAKYSNQSGNYTGTSLTNGTSKVFEPQDSDKGDIARAVFYMVARYNDYAGNATVIDANEPNLELVDSGSAPTSGYQSTKTITGKMGLLTDLLEWNKIDPPDEWEIHRNNLLYTNFTNNRNPFIDFPQWADCIWGDKVATDYAKPSTDRLNDAGLRVSSFTINLAVGASKNVKAVAANGSNVSWAVSDSEVVEISKTTSASNEEITVKGLKSGNATITVTATVDEELITKTIKVTVAEPVKINYVLYIAIGAGALVLAIIVIIIYSKGNKKTKKKIASAVKKTVKSYTSSSSSSSKKSSSSGKKKSSSSKKK